MLFSKKTAGSVSPGPARRRRPVAAVLALAAWVTVFDAGVGYAQVQSSMDRFWGDTVASANVTGPTAFSGQQAGYYTMGNISYRASQENTQIAAVQLPAVRAGCGGIDIFSGGFSFINSDQLVAQFKAVASNAVSYAFMLALKGLSPIIADQIESLSKIANEINAFNMNSCQQAQALVGGLWGRNDTASQQICQDLSTYRGFYSDRIAARHDCPNRLNRNLENLPAADKKIIPINKNIAWEAMMQNPVLRNDRQLAEMLMTLTGTMIYRCPDDGGCTVDVLPAAASDDGVITRMLDGGALKILRCDEVERCLMPVVDGSTISLPPERAFRGRVNAYTASIVNRIGQREAAQPQDISFLNMVSLPVWKMASVYTAQQGPASATATMGQYTDVIALDLLLTYLNRNVQLVEDSARNLQGYDESQLRDWRQSIAVVRTRLSDKQSDLSVKVTSIETMIARTQEAERIVNARYQTRLGEALAFSGSLAN